MRLAVGIVPPWLLPKEEGVGGLEWIPSDLPVGVEVLADVLR
jgi:hypothetical protein